MLRFQTKSDIATAITAAPLNTRPVLNARQNHVDQLSKEVIHGLAMHLRLDRDRITARSDTPGSNASLGLERLHAHVRHSLHRHTRHVQPSGVLLRRALDVTVDRDALNLGDIVKLDRLAEQPQDIAATGAAERTVLVVWRTVIPLAQTGRLGRWFEAWWRVHVA